MNAMKLLEFAGKLPMVVGGIMGIIGKVKSASKADKVDAVLASVPESLALAEFAVGKDLLDDDQVRAAMAAVANAKHDLLEAEAALKAAVLAKQPV